MKRSLLFLLLALPILSFAQSNFHKGYLLTNSSDTLQGYINYKERLVNPSSVSFKAALDGKAQTFTLDNCLGYGIDGTQSFEKYIVKVSTSSVNTANLKIGRDTSAKVETVFLKVLQKGKNVNLYVYTDEHKTRFYLSENGIGIPYELTRNVFLDTTTTGVVVYEDVYTRQLHRVMKKLNVGTISDEEKLESLKYTEMDLIKIVSLINGQKVVNSNISHTRFFAGIGLNESSGFYKGDSFLANDAAVTKHSYLPAFNVGVDILANPAIGKVIFRVALSYFMSKNEISTTSDNVAFAREKHVYDENTIALSAQVIYNFYNTKALKVFAGAGFGANISSYKNNMVTIYNSVNHMTTPAPQQISFDGFSPSIPITFGIVLHQRIELNATYVPATTTAHYDQFSVLRRRSEAGIKYLFGKN